MSKPPGTLARAVLRGFGRYEAWRFRRSNGKALAFGKHPQLLLTTVGRKSGQERTVPLFFHRDGDRLVVIASFGGSDLPPAWWLNLRASGRGQVEIDGEKFEVTPTVLEAEDRARVWQAMTRFWPSYDSYAAKTEREIPVVALDRVDSTADSTIN